MNIKPDLFEDTTTAFALKTDSELKKAKWLFTMVGNARLVNVGSAAANLAIKLRLPVSGLFRYTVYDHFCGGETFEECKKTVQQLQTKNVGVLLNYGVELKETEADFEATVRANLQAIDFAAQNPSVKAVCIKLTGFGRFDVFEKLQAGVALQPEERESFERVRMRFEKLCTAARQKNVALYVDAEETWIQEPLDALVEEMMMRFNRGACVVFNTFQLYRNDKLAYLQQQIQKAKAGNYLLGAKLVRGAYMEKERERAAQMGYASPIHESKKDVDHDFDEGVRMCLESLPHLYVCVASQSESSNLHAIQLLEKMPDADRNRVIFSQLYGMGDNITFNLARLGFTATKYLPYGPVKEVIPYLIRRAQENTSVGGQTGRELSLIQQELNRRGL